MCKRTKVKHVAVTLKIMSQKKQSGVSAISILVCSSICPFRRAGWLEEGHISKIMWFIVGICDHCHHLLPDKVKPGVVWAGGTDHVSYLCESCTINYQWLQRVFPQTLPGNQAEQNPKAFLEEASSSFFPWVIYTALHCSITNSDQMLMSKQIKLTF